jgi:hypothetical protein
MISEILVHIPWFCWFWVCGEAEHGAGRWDRNYCLLKIIRNSINFIRIRSLVLDLEDYAFPGHIL